MQSAEYSPTYPISIDVDGTPNSNTDHTRVTSLERSFCTNFTCCSLVLPDLHALFQHYAISPAHAHLPLRLRIPVVPTPSINYSPYSNVSCLSSESSLPLLSPSSPYSSQASTPPLSPTSDAKSLASSDSSPHPYSQTVHPLWPSQNVKTDDHDVLSTDVWSSLHASHHGDPEYGFGFGYGFEYQPNAVYVPSEELEYPTYEQCYRTFSTSLSSSSSSPSAGSFATRSAPKVDAPISSSSIPSLEPEAEHGHQEEITPKLSVLFSPMPTSYLSHILALSPSPLSSSASSPAPSPSAAPHQYLSEIFAGRPTSPTTNLRMTRGRASGTWTGTEIAASHTKRIRKGTEKLRKASLKLSVGDPIQTPAVATTTVKGKKSNSKSGLKLKSSSGVLMTTLGSRGAAERPSNGNVHGHGRRKMFFCPTKGCTKSYLNPNGLKYHVEKGTCIFEEAESSGIRVGVIETEGVMEVDHGGSEDADMTAAGLEEDHDGYASIAADESHCNPEGVPYSFQPQGSLSKRHSSISSSHSPVSPLSPTSPPSVFHHLPSSTTPSDYYHQRSHHQHQKQIELQHPYSQQQQWYGCGSHSDAQLRHGDVTDASSVEDVPAVDVLKDTTMEIEGSAMVLET